MKTEPLYKPNITDSMEFTVGQHYHRPSLHEVYGGQVYYGISTPKEYPIIFLFTGDSGEQYGYEDGFQDDGTFLYTGEGREGDMAFDGGNRAIRDHHQNEKPLHLFENTDESWIVSYVGEFEYVDHGFRTMHDQNDEKRRGIQFELVPAGGTEIEISQTGGARPSTENLYELAKRSKPGSTATRPPERESARTTKKSYSRSDIVREFALRMADGVCQGCGEDAPFIGSDGTPFLEVHHLYRRADGGADDPDNVIALCPNCHRRVHHGKNGDEFNKELIGHLEDELATIDSGQ